MRRYLCFLYALMAYVVFLGVLAYLAGFLCNIAVPKTIDSGESGPWGLAIVNNTALLILFAAQHTIMARTWFKKWWTRIIPEPVERSTFVLAASLILVVLYWQWQPLPAVVWSAQSPAAFWAVMAIFIGGQLVVLYGSLLIDPFDLIGLRQAYLHLRRREYTSPGFEVRSLYRYVRKPLMLGYLMIVWAAPTMTAGHLLFSSLMTAYVLIGIRFEERDLLRSFGIAYQRYRERTPMLIPRLKRC
jgi:protein-S-isoprenylcysteine O-methyltransferase Ste14